MKVDWQKYENTLWEIVKLEEELRQHCAFRGSRMGPHDRERIGILERRIAEKRRQLQEIL